jgi:hypothetical protein
MDTSVLPVSLSLLHEAGLPPKVVAIRMAGQMVQRSLAWKVFEHCI